jgi:cellulose biosynthesis protein BcsQ
MENRYKIVLLGIKGGVGKSTLGLALAKYLSRDHNVIFIDRDTSGYASDLANIKGMGLLNSVVERTNPWENIKRMDTEKGRMTVVKLFSKERTGELLSKIHTDPTLMQDFRRVYSKILLESDYDFFIVDNPPGVSYSTDIVRHESEVFYSVIPNAKSLRVYVADTSKNNIENTFDYLVNSEMTSEVPGIPLAFIVNKVPKESDKFLYIRDKVQDVINRLNVKYGVIVNKEPSLEDFSGSLIELPVPSSIKVLGDKLKNQQLDGGVILPTYDSLENIESNTVLISGKPNTRKVEMALRLIKQKAILLYTNDKILNVVKGEFTKVAVTEKFREKRFTLKDIKDVIKLAKSLSAEVLKRIEKKDKNEEEQTTVIVYRVNDISPASNCCEISSQKYEFWNTFLGSLRDMARVVLICDEVQEGECTALVPLVDISVKTDQDGYQVNQLVNSNASY